MATATLDATGSGTAGQHSVVDQPGLGGRNPMTEELHGSGNSNGMSPAATGSLRNRDLTVEGSKGESVSREAPQDPFPHSISHTPRISSRSQRAARQISQNPDSYDVPDYHANLNESLGPSPEQNPDEAALYLRKSLEQERSQEQGYRRTEEVRGKASRENPEEGSKREQEGAPKVSKLATQLYVISYLILFSFLGTLARLGLQAITFYPGAPVAFSELWANFGGSIVMGFLSEDRMLFRNEWGTPTYHRQIQKAERQKRDEEIESGSDGIVDLGAAKKAHAATKKTIPLYVGLATGFCGCLTSFSSFIRDIFLALSNELPTPLNHHEDYGPVSAAPESTVARNGGYSLMALLAVIITTIALCVSGLHFGAHLAIATERFIPSLPFKLWRKLLDPLAVFLAWGCWLGAILLAIFPPDRHSAPPEIWRGRAVFALVFAPLGCLARFYASLYLNSKIASFPLGTFAVNIFGTVILGMNYDLQHVPLGGVVGCQVLEGIQDGFCGCLTTVSTWVSELSSLRRKHAYIYGATSVVVALCFLIVIMGSMQWTRGFSEIQCAK
ncbi:CrcB-like protein [Drepanopeziza brunnea f. sp. 'multigermtubi' MB_m1]|uniref:CrcB-like protein n=1 Tax=Marssonina brunnea f. sp. multigermtubi (strain MB_m1) TaxID=1072389 RepID=K1X3X1_MARBU|nr:CrcB-like protein [Drepanopeziza brunnea f. sp. 'multigermtubi' MB_m1]EKD19921.1 CrcB-like protein [Drepanopeziza brunnea f. sp. 'multigermtubi' MB_m1]